MTNREKKLISKLYKTIFKQVYTDENFKKLLKDPDAIKKFVRKLEKSPKYKKFCKRYAVQLSKLATAENKAKWKQLFKEAKASREISLPSNFTEFEEQAYQAAVRVNFQMISSIPREILKPLEYEYAKDLYDEVVSGKKPLGAFKKKLKEGGNKNAELIARTEAAKLSTVVTEARAEQLGSVVYRWKSTNDQRTRQSHKEMNDVIVFWRKGDQKPHLDGMIGNAGEFPNCRCDPLPLTLRSLKYSFNRSTYKVYDYRKHQIVTMSRQKLLKCVEKGELI